ncbi:hypothetical protein B0H10DRAFT_1954451 [Mycena sp. CBHHK59/15]|nr:hypothetical protein B0H10DRAFT_1954451 [Mycena sp. CBHHK59/15]
MAEVADVVQERDVNQSGACIVEVKIILNERYVAHLTSALAGNEMDALTDSVFRDGKIPSLFGVCSRAVRVDPGVPATVCLGVTLPHPLRRRSNAQPHILEGVVESDVFSLFEHGYAVLHNQHCMGPSLCSAVCQCHVEDTLRWPFEEQYRGHRQSVWENCSLT